MPVVDRTICERCRAEVTAKAQFCPMCGAPRQTQASDPLIGTVIADRYLLREPIGQGGAGTIYRADHVTLRRKVAVKILHHELARDDLAVERFRREATTVGEIDNEHIVEVLDFGRTTDGRPFLVMELLDGETLQAALHREGKLPIDQALDILQQVGEALMEAHAMGYVHRDLRPGNIFLARRKGRRFVKILDFGLAKLVDPSEGGDGQSAASTLGMTFGDPCYMSPEQARGEAVERRADIYALGIMAFELLIGEPPFVGEKVFDVLTQHIESTPATPSALRPDVPEWLDAVVLRALAKQPGERFITVYRFIEALREGQRTGAVMSEDAALSMPSVEPPPPAPRRKDSDTGVIAVTVAEAAQASASQRMSIKAMEPGASQGWYDVGEKLDSAPTRPIVNEVFVETVPTDKPSRTPLFAALGVVIAGAGLAIAYVVFGTGAPSEPPAAPRAEVAKAEPVAAMPPRPDPVVVTPPPSPEPTVLAVVPPAPPPPAPLPKTAPAPAPVKKAPAPAARSTKAVAAAKQPPVVDFRPAAVKPDDKPGEKVDAKPEEKPPAKSAEMAEPEAAPPSRPPPEDRNPVQAEFYVKLGQRALRDGDLDGAVESFNKARGFDNLNADAIAGLGQVAMKQGRPGDATVHLEAAARLAPGSARIQTLRGQAYLAAGKREEAAAAFKKALKLNPDDQAAVAGYKLATGDAGGDKPAESTDAADPSDKPEK